MNRPPSGRDPRMTSRRTALRSMGALCLSLGAGQIARGAGIVAVRVWPADEYTRVTIESDEALQAKHFMAQDPQRLVASRCIRCSDSRRHAGRDATRLV